MISLFYENFSAAKSMEDLQVAEDKVGHLNQIKSKLESTLDELEGSYEKEKRSRANIEKERRKIEGELKTNLGMIKLGKVAKGLSYFVYNKVSYFWRNCTKRYTFD